jgi:hypothetical protein
MTAFSAAIDAIFADANMAADAVWTKCSGGPGVACRVIVKNPDAADRFGDGQITRETVMIDVRLSDVASPCSGDAVVSGGVTYLIQGEPARDRLRLVWKCEAREV